MAGATEISQAEPFPRVADIDNKTLDEISRMGLLPPFHPRCRCDVVMLWKKTGTDVVSIPPPGDPGRIEEVRGHLQKTMSGYRDAHAMSVFRAAQLGKQIHCLEK